MAPARLDVAAAQDRRARIAVAALFLTNGAIFANLLPRYPEIKTDLALSNAVYGAAVAAFSGGALVAGLTAAALIRRFRSSRVAVVGTIGIAVFVVAAGLASSPVVLAAALFIAGASDAITDVAQNAHGLRVQRNYGRSIINSFHAVWAVGAILGGLMGAAAIALHIPRATHLAIAAACSARWSLVAYPYLLPGPDHDDHPSARTEGGGGAGVGVYATLVALVVIAIAGATIEDAGSSWATLYLRDSLGAPAAVAAFGYVALVGFMFIGRLIGDRLVDRFGERGGGPRRRVHRRRRHGARAGVPQRPGDDRRVRRRRFRRRHADSGRHARRGSTARAAAGYRADRGDVADAGRLLSASPPIVGLIADATSLRVGLLSVPVAGVVVMALAGALSAPRRPSRS